MSEPEGDPTGLGRLGRDLERLAVAGLVGATGLLGALGLLVVVLTVVLVATLTTSLDDFAGGLPSLGLLSNLAGAGGPRAGEIPADQLGVMRQTEARSACHLPWTILAGVASVESSFGRNMGPSSAGAIGYGQFLPATWVVYGAGGNPWDYHDALPAMDRYLCAMVAEFGVGRSPDEALKRALFYYNHGRAVPFDPNDGYVRDVLTRAAAYAAPASPSEGATRGGLIPGWAGRPALNQYECANYRSPTACLQWAPAACSAAALDWLLGAYGVHLDGIDDAIALIGPGTGISTRVGLLDSSGPRLAGALTAEGLTPRRAQLRSPDQLRAWVSQGPVALDGHAWFGVGHWFVAIASDGGGIFTRDSSGHDVRYLSWGRLYGEVGWSGWAVGVQAAGEVSPA